MHSYNNLTVITGHATRSLVLFHKHNLSAGGENCLSRGEIDPIKISGALVTRSRGGQEVSVYKVLYSRVHVQETSWYELFVPIEES